MPNIDQTLIVRYTVVFDRHSMTEDDVRHLNPAFLDSIARQGLSVADFAARAGVARSTIHALLNPSQHPDRRRGMYRTTAWKLARGYATVARLSDDDAYAQIIVEDTSARGADGQRFSLRRSVLR